MERTTLRTVEWPAGLAAVGAAWCCWGLALGGYWHWPVAVAHYGTRAFWAANATPAQGLLLAALCGALLAAAAASVAARRPAPDARATAADD
jgi:hypothetical protein